MRAQTFASNDNIRAMAASKTLELNPRHPIVIELNSLVTSAPDDQATKDLGHLLFDTALLASGFQQDDLEGYSERMIRTLAKTLNLDSLDLAPETAVEAEEEVEAKDEKKPASENAHDEF